MPPKCSKEDIDLMVQRAVAAAVQASVQLTADLTANFDAKHELLAFQFNKIKSDNNELQDQITQLEMSLATTESKLNKQEHNFTTI